METITFNTFGNEYPDKHFLLIDRQCSACGIFSHIVTALNWIKYAEQHNFIPVININSNNYYKNTNENLWDLLFEQPNKFNVNDIQTAKYVANVHHIIGHPDYPYTKSELFKIDSKIASTYIKLKPNIQTIVDNFLTKYRYETILGVLIRGTDYLQLKPKHHHIQPSIDMVIEKIYQYLNLYKCTKLFIVTEDKLLFEKLYFIFGDILITNDNIFIDNYTTGLIRSAIKSKFTYNEFKQLNINYVANIFILAQLPYIIAGITSATMFLNLVMHPTQFSFFNLGRYS